MATTRTLATIAIVLAAATVGLTGTAPPATAAFPGANGRIVFEREMPAGNHTQTDLFTLDPGSGAVRRLTATTGVNEFGPQYDAAGRRLVFWRTAAPFGPGTVWRADASGANAVALTSGVDARDPAWSPDGRRIVFARYSAAGTHLWSMRAADGGLLRQLTSGPASDFEPAWSPDGSRIAFTRAAAQGDPGDLYVLTLASGVVTRVTHTPAYDHQVAWSPDGHTLLFERDLDRSSVIAAVPAAGGSTTVLTHGGFFDVGPAWSPDGTAIAFGSDRSGGLLDDLYVMNADGSGLRPLLALPYSEGFPDWQPLP